uniref:Uncharacterized protein n=1 Tax=Arundo donax TaxID=35708 RepID=A0A0A9A8R0_ARUDO
MLARPLTAPPCLAVPAELHRSLHATSEHTVHAAAGCYSESQLALLFPLYINIHQYSKNHRKISIH